MKIMLMVYHERFHLYVQVVLPDRPYSRPPFVNLRLVQPYKKSEVIEIVGS